MRQAAIAGNYAQYRNYLKEHRLTEKELPYLDNALQMRGLHLDKVVRIGTWKDREADYILGAFEVCAK